MEPVPLLAALLLLPRRGARWHRGRRHRTRGAKPAARLSRPHTSSEWCSLSYALPAHSGLVGSMLAHAASDVLLRLRPWLAPPRKNLLPPLPLTGPLPQGHPPLSVPS